MSREMRGSASACSNIALIKYWGKTDFDDNIPMNGSVSMTLSEAITTTTVVWDASLSQDEIYLDGEEVSQRPARERDIAFVFQMFALYPHMNVRRNISYPLVSLGYARTDVDAKIADAEAANAHCHLHTFDSSDPDYASLKAQAEAMKARNRHRPIRSSTLSPKIHRLHMLLTRCSRPPCRNMLLRNGSGPNGGKPTAAAQAGSV